MNKFSLSPLIKDGMVLKLGDGALISGKDEVGHQIKVLFQGREYSQIVDSNGEWKINLEKLESGGPFEMEITGTEFIRINDVYVGFVFLCGGQSNMQLPLARVLDLFEDEVKQINNPYIRQFLVPIEHNFMKKQETLSDGEWKCAIPENIMEFTAVGYFTAEKIYEKYKIPIGIVFSAMGGSTVEAWMPKNELEKLSNKRYINLLSQFQDDEWGEKRAKSDLELEAKWFSELEKNDKSLEDILREDYRIEAKSDAMDKSNENNINVSIDDNLNSEIISKRVYVRGCEMDKSSIARENMNNLADVDVGWSNTKLPVTLDEIVGKDFWGSVWFKKEFELTETEFLESKNSDIDILLRLGTCIDADKTYVNGTLVGETGYCYPPRRYYIKKNILQQGKNTIIVHLNSFNGTGRWISDMPYYLKIGKYCISLENNWEYQVGYKMKNPKPDIMFFPHQPAGLFHSMIWPIRNYTYTNVFFYQGESNIESSSEYEYMFGKMINIWRETFKQPNLPFLYVQLTNYLDPARPEILDTNWSKIRDAQRRAMYDVENIAMAVIIDIGQSNELHPQNKKEVGRRLALLFEDKIMHENVISSGPMIKNIKIETKKIILSFDEIGSGLILKERNDKESGFEIAGEDGKYKKTNARIENNNIVLEISEEEKAIEYVRYAYGDDPVVTLFNKEGLPASPFIMNINEA